MTNLWGLMLENIIIGIDRMWCCIKNRRWIGKEEYYEIKRGN
jgi:hypothetical protein